MPRPRGGMCRRRSDVGLSDRAQPWRWRGELDGDQGDVAVIPTGEKVDRALVQQSLVVGQGLGRRSRQRGGVDRRGGAVGELDLAQDGDCIEIVGGSDPHVNVEHCGGRSSRLGREHAPAAEAGVAEGHPERLEVNVVDREPRRTVSKQNRRQCGQQPDDNRRRVGDVGIDGQPLRRNEAHRVGRPPAHHPDATAPIVSDETDVAGGQQFVEGNVAVLRVCVRPRHPHATRAGHNLLTRDQRRRLIKCGPVQNTKGQHRGTRPPRDAVMTADPRPTKSGTGIETPVHPQSHVPHAASRRRRSTTPEDPAGGVLQVPVEDTQGDAPNTSSRTRPATSHKASAIGTSRSSAREGCRAADGVEVFLCR